MKTSSPDATPYTDTDALHGEVPSDQTSLGALNPQARRMCDTPSKVPPGFDPVPQGRGYMSSLGELYLHRERPILAVRITPQHLNNLAVPHGGMLAMLADTALGMLMAREAGLPGVTVSLSVDYLSSGRLGDWVEAHVEFDKLGAHLRFGGCRLLVGERCLLKANAVFAVPRPRSAG